MSQPGLADRGILRVPLLSKCYQLLLCLGFGASGVNQAQVGCYSFTVFVGHIAQGIADHVNDAPLHCGFGKQGFYCFWEARQAITTGDEDVLESPRFCSSVST